LVFQQANCRPALDPNKTGNRYVLIERYNGTVAVTKELQEGSGAHLRPEEKIVNDPLGYSVGPKSGRFKWALSHAEIVEQWEDELVFARQVKKLLLGLTVGDATLADSDYDQ
jgi:hypothetical protein